MSSAGLARRQQVRRQLEAAAEAAGRTVVRLPGIGAAACATWAAWDAFGRPAGLGVLAVFLLVVDRRMP